MISSRITRSLAAFAIGASALLTIPASPAAAGIVDTDQVLLNGPNADFGANTSVHSWGRPDIGGFVSWGDNTGHNNWVSVFGKVWVDNFWGGGCARIRATFRNSNLSTVATNTETVCYGGYSAPASDHTDFRQSSTSIRSVRLCTSFRAPGTSNFVTQACKTEYRD